MDVSSGYATICRAVPVICVVLTVSSTLATVKCVWRHVSCVNTSTVLTRSTAVPSPVYRRAFDFLLASYLRTFLLSCLVHIFTFSVCIHLRHSH